MNVPSHFRRFHQNDRRSPPPEAVMRALELECKMLEDDLARQSSTLSEDAFSILA
jgi:hypothetical protein